MDNDTHHVVRIDTIDLSYNQLHIPFSELANLLKSWQSSTVIFAGDNTVVDSINSKDLFASIETLFVSSSHKMFLTVVLIGSFLFAYNAGQEYMSGILSNYLHINAVYIQNCTTTMLNFTYLIKPDLITPHVLGTSITKSFLKRVVTLLQKGKICSLFLYDSTLIDQTAEEIGSLILTSNFVGVCWYSVSLQCKE